MVSEKRNQSQLPQVIDSERLKTLQQLQRNIDPFQEGSSGERIRALTLNNLYLQMADPSLEVVEAVCEGLVTMPFANLRELGSATYRAGQDPEQFFAEHKITVDDPERLQIGISNSGGLLDDIYFKHDSQTGELRWGEDLNPKTLAEYTYEKLQISKGERQLRKAAQQVHDEPGLEKRSRMGRRLKKQVLDYIGSFQFTFSMRYDSSKTVEPTWENLTSFSGISARLETKGGGSTIGNFGFENAIHVAHAAIKRYPFEKKLEGLPTRDKERFEKLRLQYGAKAANLIILSELIGDVNRLRRNLFDWKLAVPDFQAVPVDSYRAWREGKLLDTDLHPYFEWASGLKQEQRWSSDEPVSADYMVRSSAVFSEDGENVTGAGVYESVRVYGGSTFQDFKDAVTKVYESTNSAQAQAYRAQHGIETEDMGLVIQKYISPYSFSMHGVSSEGYVNSRLSGVPQLMEIVTKTSRNFVNRKELDFYLALDAVRNKSAFRGAHHFPPDQYKVNTDLPIQVAQLTYIVERIWGKDIQVEFVIDESQTANFVQVRDLPSSAVVQVPEVQFPQETPIHSGASIGVGDLELPILDDEVDNNEKIGAVLISGNYGWSNQYNAYRLPKEGAVIIGNDSGQNGHIQTLCAEQGLICIFPEPEKVDESIGQYTKLFGLKRIRVVSNGIEARVYEAGK